MSVKGIYLVAALMLVLALPASAQTVPSGAVVELFTSEGCSDCPPADALLGELARSAGVIALAYHVTYWDRLGWPDRFELRRSDERQEYYAKELHLPALFTPQAVVDGQVSLIGSDRRALSSALKVKRATIPITLSLTTDQVQVELPRRELPAPVSVILVGYLPQAVTAIHRGENAGRSLREFNIVRAYDVLGVWRGGSRRFLLPLGALPSDASRIAVLLQQPAGRIVGAATLAVR